MRPWLALWALAITVVGGVAVLVGVPPVVGLPAVIGALLVAPALAAARHLPDERVLDLVALVTMFSIGLLVVVSGFLALLSAWSGSTALFIIGLVTVTLALAPTPGWADRLTGLPPVRDDEVTVRVLWFDGRLFCQLSVDRVSGAIVGLDLGRHPNPAWATAMPTTAARAGVIHGQTAIEALIEHHPTRHRRGRLLIDIERQPRLSRTDDELYLWLGPDIDDRSLDDATIHHWVVGTVRDRPVAFGLTRSREPVVIRVGPEGGEQPWGARSEVRT